MSLLCVLRLPYQVFEQGFQSSGPTPTASPLGGLSQLSYLDERQLYQQSFVGRLSVVDVALVHQAQGTIEEAQVATLRLLLQTLPLLFACLKQWQGLWVFSHHHVTHVFGKPPYQ